MSDDYQIHIPPSFFALYADARQRLTEPIARVRDRYEVCEDLANHLVSHAQVLNHVEVPLEAEILTRIHDGLSTPEAGVSGAEATWIVRRLAELLGWSSAPFEHPHAGR
ncbi:hypothetical protein H4CHR_05791 [Variovorax sp. PBS-H4]|uniref:hypothetical protein n=1 Tax=Variovorax sp. PBS-H4 TaxID=434008 RepID=UPI0013196E24|nr:hypothetical protein [Variovorax sp. PBS-H4]VTU41057.1 hypothetical protein H4CHR_05791 [Variovorax sp. PBS-H4]